MRVVAALGGNALLRRGEPAEAGVQRRRVASAAQALAPLAAEHDLIVTHGNGPQVGLLALQAAAYDDVAPYPLDVLGAESEGMVGYLLEQELGNVLPGRRLATLLTQVTVDPEDPAFSRPSKPIGPMYDELQARRLARARGWAIAPDGDGWRRVVASPEPLRVVELETIRLLVESGVTVVCAGGGGIPVLERDGALHGVEAVVDKDLAASLLARDLEADALLLLTDVPAVQAEWGTPHARPIHRATGQQLLELHLAEGSMEPKARAASRFTDATGRPAVIAALSDAVAALAGDAGTRVLAS